MNYFMIFGSVINNKLENILCLYKMFGYCCFLKVFFI